MVDADAKDIVSRFDRLKAARAPLEVQWQEIAELAKPMRADFTVSRIPGQRRGLQMFDGTAMQSADNLASGLWGMVTNSANEWFRLKHPDDTLNRNGEVKAWLDDSTRIMRDVFSAGGQRFYAAALEKYGDLVSFGTSVFYTAESEKPGRLFFSNRPLRECVIAQDDEEVIDTVIRRFEWTATQAWKRWGNQCGKSVMRALEGDEPDRKFTFYHCTMPNEDMRPGRRDARGKAFSSIHVSLEDMLVLQRGGYDEFPYQVARWSTASGGLYGDSPAMLAQVDTVTLQAMEKTQLVASQKAADPPLLAPDENALRSVRTTPGGITYGAVDANGRPLVQALETRGAFTLTLEMAEQKRNAIRNAFYGALLTMVATPGATATEVLARQEEQLRLMGPHLGRLQAEFHDPLITRVFNLLWRSNAFAPPPDILRDAPMLSVEYVSPLARAQKTQEAASIMRTMEAALPLAQVDPTIISNFDMDEVVRGLSDGFGLPARMLKDPKVVAGLRAQAEQAQAAQAQAAQLAGAAQAMGPAARGVKDLVAANAMAGGGLPA